MTGIEILTPEGKSLDLNPGTKIQLNLVNTAFDAEILKGSYTFTFGLPLTAFNRLTFGFPEDIEANSTFITEYEGFKLKCGLVEFIIKINVVNITNTINISILTGSGIQADKMKKTFLKDIDMGEVVIDTSATYTLCIRKNFETIAGLNLVFVEIDTGGSGTFKHGIDSAYYALPEYDNLVSGIVSSINRAPIRLPQEWNPATVYAGDDQVWITRSGKLYSVTDAGTVGDPDISLSGLYYIGLYADYVTLRNAAIYPGWPNYDDPSDPKNYSAIPYLGIGFILKNATLTSDWFETTLLSGNKKECAAVLDYMLQIANADFLDGDHKFFPVKDENFGSDFGNVDCINYWRFGGFANENLDENQTAFSVLNDPEDNVIVQNHCVPMLRSLFILEKAHEIMGLDIDSESVFENDFLKTLFTYSNFSNENWVLKNLSGSVNVHRNFFGTQFKKQSCTPDISIADFINGFRSMFFIGAWFDFFQEKIKWKPLADVLADFENAIDITNLVPGFDDIKFEPSPGFRLEYTNDGSDAVSSNQLKDKYSEKVIEQEPVDNIEDLPTPTAINWICLVKYVERYFISIQKEDNTFDWVDWAGWLDGKKVNASANPEIYQPKASTLINWVGSDGRLAPNSKIKKISLLIMHLSGQYAQIYTLGYVSPIGNIVRFFRDVETSETDLEANGFQELTEYSWKVPYAGKSRKSIYFSKDDTCSLRLLSYAGLRENPLNNNPLDQYPQASCDLYDLTGPIFSDTRGGSLRFDGDYGLYNQWGKEWLDFLQKAKVASIQIPIDEILLQKLKPWKQVKIRNKYFMWSNIKLNLPLDSSLATITLYSNEI